jgi:hypothetical protein
MTTGEFRVAPDISASTAQFQAFADSRPQSGQWSVPAAAPARNPRRLTGVIVAAVVVLVILVVVIAKVA